MTKSIAAQFRKTEQERVKPRSVWQAAPLLLLLLACVALFTGLGLWQLHRLAWKLELIATVDARVHASPVPIPPVDSWAGLDVNELIYQRVALSGVYDHGAEVQSLAVTELGPGYWVLTPLLLEGAGSVMINRGYVPQALKNPASRSELPPSGRVDITGLLRASEPEGGFLRNNDPAADRWFSRDTIAMGEAQQLPKPVAPFFVDADATASPAADSQQERTDETNTTDTTDTNESTDLNDSSFSNKANTLTDSSESFPRAGLTVIAFRNTHLVYALTWFALAGMACVGLYLVLRERYRQ